MGLCGKEPVSRLPRDNKTTSDRSAGCEISSVNRKWRRLWRLHRPGSFEARGMVLLENTTLKTSNAALVSKKFAFSTTQGPIVNLCFFLVNWIAPYTRQPICFFPVFQSTFLIPTERFEACVNLSSQSLCVRLDASDATMKSRHVTDFIGKRRGFAGAVNR